MKKYIIPIFVLIIIGGVFTSKQIMAPETKTPVEQTKQIKVSQSIPGSGIPVIKQEKIVKEGTTALELLKVLNEVTTKGEGVNAYVTKINLLEADDSKKQFWSFYVNGKQAPVGAGGYKLKNGDSIEWKIETY